MKLLIIASILLTGLLASAEGKQGVCYEKYNGKFYNLSLEENKTAYLYTVKGHLVLEGSYSVTVTKPIPGTRYPGQTYYDIKLKKPVDSLGWIKSMNLSLSSSTTNFPSGGFGTLKASAPFLKESLFMYCTGLN